MSGDNHNEEAPKWRDRNRRSIADSFSNAFEGLYHVFNTQPHMRVHTIIIALVLLAAWGFGVSRVELLHLLLPMTLVIMAEVINTALEEIVDLEVEGYQEKARIVKDVAAAAVLVAAFYSMLAGVMIFASNENFRATLTVHPRFPARPHLGALQIVLVGMLLLGVAIVWIKRATGGRYVLTGGFASGHTALGFLIAASIAMISGSAELSALALALALLLAQSRLQSDIHTLSEVGLGALVGIIVALIVFAWPVLTP
ncbi:MAG TPA: diacylglycerol kinase [Armatimonadota bacterium]|nr:diacylglycerol kinase [Armatimonadota bacterium]